MDRHEISRSVGDVYLSSVDRTLRELQRMVKENEEALDMLRSSATAQVPGVGESAKVSLDIMANAFDAVNDSAPYLPSEGSVLPALLALRKTHQITTESKAYEKSREKTLTNSRRDLEAEKANVADQEALRVALEKRIITLRDGLETSSRKTAEQIAHEKLDELREKKKNYDKETTKLVRALNKFMSEHLGALLAAEGLGGPVVGDMMDVDTDDLGAGFNAQGKPKKSKAVPDEDVRQRRIDEIWGAASEQGQQRRRQSNRDVDEASAAGAEMRHLTEQLLNSLMASEGDSSAAYVEIPRETAAVRFLVRAKVAQFHPKDANKLRLVDFGRELDE